MLNEWVIFELTKSPGLGYPQSFEELKDNYLSNSFHIIGGLWDLPFVFLYVFGGLRFSMVGGVLGIMAWGLLSLIALLIFAILKKKLVLHLHENLDKQFERERIIKNYFEMQGPYQAVPPVIHPVVQDWNSLGAKKFCEKYFAKSGSGLVSFISERAIRNRDLNGDFLYYAVSVPRAKEMSVDRLRKILLAYQMLHLSGPLNLEAAFSLYSLSDLETLFTNPYNRSYVLELHDKVNLPITRDFFALKEKLKEINLPPILKALDKKEIEGFIFKVLVTRNDYDWASNEFSNCARQYWDKHETLVLVYKKLEPIACVSISGTVVGEIKGPHNRECYGHEEGFIRETLRKEGLI